MHKITFIFLSGKLFFPLMTEDLISSKEFENSTSKWMNYHRQQGKAYMNCLIFLTCYLCLFTLSLKYILSSFIFRARVSSHCNIVIHQLAGRSQFFLVWFYLLQFCAWQVVSWSRKEWKKLKGSQLLAWNPKMIFRSWYY